MEEYQKIYKMNIKISLLLSYSLDITVLRKPNPISKFNGSNAYILI
jgi:hypothetical protein